MKSLLLISVLLSSLSGFGRSDLTLSGTLISYSKTEIVLERKAGLYRVELKDVLQSIPRELSANLVGRLVEITAPVTKIRGERKSRF